MLIRLFGENFRSFRGPFDLSFVAADLQSEGNRGIAKLVPSGEQDPFRVLRCLAIFGANASGKSTVLLAASALQWLIRESSRKLEPEKPLPVYQPFALDPASRESPTTLGCTIFYEHRFFEYRIEFSRYQIQYERLMQLDEPEAPLLLRSSSGSIGGRLYDSSEHIRALISLPRSNTPVFSFLAQHGPAQGAASVLPLWNAFRQRLRHRDYSFSHGLSLFDSTAKKFFTNPKFKDWAFAKLIGPADLGIRDLSVKEIELPPVLLSAPEEVRKQFARDAPFYQTSFRHGDDVTTVLDLDDESFGTQKIYSLAPDWWSLSHDSTTLFCDELSASLHPTLLDNLVRAVSRGSSNRRVMSQMVFSTHESGLLESRGEKRPALRRDQVYFVKKSKDGASTLYSLAEFGDEARAVHNIRKRYLEDRYDAIPSIEDLGL